MTHRLKLRDIRRGQIFVERAAGIAYKFVALEDATDVVDDPQREGVKLRGFMLLGSIRNLNGLEGIVEFFAGTQGGETYGPHLFGRDADFRLRVRIVTFFPDGPVEIRDEAGEVFERLDTHEAALVVLHLNGFATQHAVAQTGNINEEALRWFEVWKRRIDLFLTGPEEVPLAALEPGDNAKTMLAAMFDLVEKGGDGIDRTLLERWHEFAIAALGKLNAGMPVPEDTFVGLDAEKRRHVFGAFAASMQQTAHVRLAMLQANAEKVNPELAIIEWENGIEGDGHFTLRGVKYEYAGMSDTRTGGPHDGMKFYAGVNPGGEEVWVSEATPGEFVQAYMRKEAVAAGFAN